MCQPFLPGLIRGLFLLLALVETSSPHASGSPALRREANQTIRLPLEPSSFAPAFSYSTANLFDALSFASPVAVTTPPGENNRLFVIERSGRIIVISDLNQPSRTVYLDISDRVDFNYQAGAEGLTGLAFHPGYKTNGYFYVVYTLKGRTAAGSGAHNRLARFQVSATNPNLALAASEVPLLTQYDEGYSHDWNDLQFGPDGYLYIAVGDEGDSHDQYANSQRIDKDLFSGILRIDVDKRAGNLPPNSHPAITANYSVPVDNPFVGATQFLGASVDPVRVRTEFFAVGLRNPWRISFDPATGLLYCGDVGQHAAEEIDIIVKGGNYGWAFREGLRNGFRGDPPPGIGFVPPIIEYGHGYGPNEGNCVIGGIVYRGEKIPQLNGAYVFGDYASGHIWISRFDGSRASAMERLTSDPGVVGFGRDPRNGDVLLVDHDEGKIKRLEYRAESSGMPLPGTLSGTGVFKDLAALTPEQGVVPYDINVPFWSDGARKQRWFSIPDPGAKIGFSRDGNWAFPEGTIWIKHFELDLGGTNQTPRRVETRLLVRNSKGVYGITYRWGNSLNDAALVPEEGLDEPFIISSGGVIRTQVWHYPSRTECLICHTPPGGHALGFSAAQLNRDGRFGNATQNQILALSEAGYFTSPVTDIETLSFLSPAHDDAASLEHRVRSYLSANCSQCHQPGGTSAGYFDARNETPTASANLINGPLSNNHRNFENRVVRPGSLERSMLLTRIANLGASHMPPLATSVIDTNAVTLLSAWITNDLPRYEMFSDWQLRNFSSTNQPDALAGGDPDRDGAANWAEYIAGTDPRLASDAWRVAARYEANKVRLSFLQPANRAYEVQFANQLMPPVSWQPLRSSANRPFFPATNRVVTIEDDAGQSGRYYRVRLFPR